MENLIWFEDAGFSLEGAQRWEILIWSYSGKNRTREESRRLLVLKFWISSCMRTERKVLFRDVLTVWTKQMDTGGVLVLQEWRQRWFQRVGSEQEPESSETSQFWWISIQKTERVSHYRISDVCMSPFLFLHSFVQSCPNVLSARGLHSRTWTGSPVESCKWAAVTGRVVFQTSSQLWSWDNHDFCHLQFCFLQLFHNKSQFVFHQLNTFNEKQQLECLVVFWCL